MSTSPTKSIAYPPGGVLIWIIIYLELITFGMAMLGLAYYGSQDRELYHLDSLKLNRVLATINTMVLLTSGYFAARAVHYFKQKDIDRSSKLLLWTIFAGLGFLVLKSIEYYQKLGAGLDMNYSPFFMNYWLLTGFHWIHVLVGIVIVYFLRRNLIKKRETASLEDLEAGISFWHMCDLIWLLLFPLLYLLF
ncbi:MAG: cytochrome c oxidase subunit 3 [Chitinophagales bacterium]|nr:cytochrome c oxidase subunit 3 [Chitinophagales bacterium]